MPSASDASAQKKSFFARCRGVHAPPVLRSCRTPRGLPCPTLPLGKLEDLHGGFATADVDGISRRRRDPVLVAAAPHFLRHEHARPKLLIERLDSRRKVHHVTYHRVFLASRGADVPDDRWPCVKAEADPGGRNSSRPDQALDAGKHFEPCI